MPITAASATAAIGSAANPYTARVHPMRRAGDAAALAQPGTAVVAVAPVRRVAAPNSATTRPDPSFVAQLLATAEQDPQTRVLRRAPVADVDAIYRAANQNQTAVPMGMVTRRSA